MPLTKLPDKLIIRYKKWKADSFVNNKATYEKPALDLNRVSIHGLWNDIGTGKLEMLNPETMTFMPC